jgi:putative phosphoesterase
MVASNKAINVMIRIGLISDVHSRPAPVAEALSIFSAQGVDQVWCAGDIAGYGGQLEETVALLVESGCRTVRGNHELRYLAQAGTDPVSPAYRFLRQLPAVQHDTVAGKRVYMVHAHPPDACTGGIKLLDQESRLIADRAAYWSRQLQLFDFDVLVVGHTHQVFAERLGNTLVVNPGSSAFNHSCAILDLPAMSVELFPLSGKEIERTWNWSAEVVYGG